jgi:hypothetical protein
MLYITSFNTIFVILCFIYVYLKEKDYQKKRNLYAQLFESMSQEIHFIKKSINEQKHYVDKQPKFDDNRMQESIKKQSIKILNDVLPDIIDSIHKLDESFKSFKNKIQIQNEDISKQVKQYSDLSKYTDSSTDDRQIIRMYESGKSSIEISRKLGIAKSEIDLIIKMHKA